MNPEQLTILRQAFSDIEAGLNVNSVSTSTQRLDRISLVQMNDGNIQVLARTTITAHVDRY